MKKGKFGFKSFGMAIPSGLLLVHAGLFSAGSLAHDHASHGGQEAKPPVIQAGAASVRLLDLELTNQEGKAARFKSEVIGDRIVVLDNIYTSCTTICSLLTTTMAKVHGDLGARAGNEVALVSLSVDPVTDTPQRLRSYASRHKTAWDLWTGQKTAMDRILKGLGLFTPSYVDHPPSILVGDGKSGEWTRFNGFASPEQLVAKVDELLSARRGALVKTEAGE